MGYHCTHPLQLFLYLPEWNDSAFFPMHLKLEFCISVHLISCSVFFCVSIGVFFAWIILYFIQSIPDNNNRLLAVAMQNKNNSNSSPLTFLSSRTFITHYFAHTRVCVRVFLSFSFAFFSRFVWSFSFVSMTHCIHLSFFAAFSNASFDSII